MKQAKVILISSILFSQFLSCKDTGTGPNQKPFKDPREMTWTADTLPVPQGAIQVLPEDMLVVSPTDVWLATWVGHGQIIHYDGTTWKLARDVGGGGIDCLALGGNNTLWAGGYVGRDVGGQFTQNAFVLSYNGSSWQENEMDIKSGILAMCTDPSGNIWACGSSGVVLKYSQSKWIADTIRISGFSQNDCYLYSLSYYNEKIYLLARNNANTQFAYLSGDVKNWTTLDIFSLTNTTSVIKWGTLGCIKEKIEKLYSYGLGGIWLLGSSSWDNIFSSNGAVRDLSGPSENYLIGVGAFRTFLYNNGTSWQNMGGIIKGNDPYFAFNNAWTDGYEIIMVGYTSDGISKTIVFQGK